VRPVSLCRGVCITDRPDDPSADRFPVLPDGTITIVALPSIGADPGFSKTNR
jgi:hypothetical protein